MTTQAPRIGPYELEAVAGRGSSGVVYRAFDEMSGEAVALKMLDARTLEDPMARARFARECELVGAFAHPGLVRLRAAGSIAHGQDYLVMDLADGPTLKDRLRAQPIGLRAGLALIAEAGDALGAMHAAGWVHRDVKPANLVLDEEDHPRILDFGLASRAGADGEARLTKAGFFVGTPLYLAPEQLVGGAPSPAMDVYALAAMLYEILVGEPPFVGATEALLTRKTMDDAPEYPGPEPIRALLKAGLSRRPADRPPDGRAWARELREIMMPMGETPDLEPALVPSVRPMIDAATLAESSPDSRTPEAVSVELSRFTPVPGTTPSARQLGASAALPTTPANPAPVVSSREVEEAPDPLSLVALAQAYLPEAAFVVEPVRGAWLWAAVLVAAAGGLTGLGLKLAAGGFGG